jgi:O-antigen/teichoic acid export membrane protein
LPNPITSLKKSALAKNTFWMFMGQGLRIFVQAGYFIIIARMLGPSQYGSFGAVLALAAIISPFASLGFGNIVIKNVVYDPSSFRTSWGNTVLVTMTSGTLIVGALIGIAHFALPLSTPFSLIIFIGISDVIANRLIDASAQCFQAYERLAYTAAITLLPSIARTLSAIYLHWRQPHATAQQWGYYYMNATLICAVASYCLVSFTLGHPKLRLSEIPGTLAEGVYFSVSLSSQTIYNDIDKTMLARLSTLDAAGIYITAYRIIDMSFVPVRSLIFASYARFFEHGKGGLSTTFKYGKKLMKRSVGYSCAMGIVLFLVAPVIPKVLGVEYDRSVLALRMLAILPLFKSTHYFLAQALMGAGYQSARAAVQVGIAILNVVANICFMPRYSWQGAAWISIFCDAFLIIALYVVLLFYKSKEQRQAEASCCSPGESIQT